MQLFKNNQIYCKKIIIKSFLFKQLFVGNIDKSIPFDEVKNYFYSNFKSIIRSKLIVDQETGRSKGYAFFEFSNYKEFNNALNIKDPLIFGKQKLVLNSAKNRFDQSDEELNNDLSLQNSESFNSLNQTLPLSTTETRVSSNRNSKESSNSYINNNNNSILEDKGKNEKDMEKNYNSELSLLIRDSLKKLSEKYYQYDNKPNIFNYYCSSFIHNSQNNKDFHFVNIYNENKKDNYLYRKCPFELCEEIIEKK